MTITASSNSKVYDGKAYGPNPDPTTGDFKPYTVSAPIADSGLVEGHTVDAYIEVFPESETEGEPSEKTEAINAGTYKLRINNEDGENGVKITDGTNDVTDNYAITLEDGTLTINPRPVTISVITPRAKVYDGKAYEPNASIEEEEQEPEPPFTVSAVPFIEDSGLVAGHTVDATIEVFPESETEDEQGETTEAINVGTYKLRINNDENGKNKVKITSADNVDVTANYDIRLDDGTLTINRRPVTISVVTPRAKVYDGKAYEPNALIEKEEGQEPELPYTYSEFNKEEKSGLVEGHTVDAYIEVFPESETEGEQGETTEAINAGTYTLRINNEDGENGVKITDGTNDVTANYVITLDPGELTIDPRPVYVYAIGSKSFGTVDPVDDEGNPVFEIKDDVARNDAQNAGMVDGEDVNDVVLGEDGVEKRLIDVGTLTRKEGEQPGEYAITSDNAEIMLEEGQVQGNYTVHFLPMSTGEDAASTGSFFTITEYMPWKVQWLDDETGEGADETGEGPINSHDAQAAFRIVPNEGVELLPAKEFGAEVIATVTANAPENESAVKWESLPVFTKEMSWADDETTGLTATFGIPDVNYSFVTGEGEDATTYAWTSGLPAGTEVTVEVAYKEQAADAEPADSQIAVTDVVPVETEIGFSYPENAHKGDNFMVMDANGTVKLAQNAPYVCDEEVIGVTINGNVTIYMTYGSLRITGLNLEALKALLGITAEAAWCNANPAENLTITAALVDSLNHVAAAPTANVRFDTGAVNTTQTVGNRPTEESIALNIGESEQFGSLSESPVTGTFGGSTPVITAANGVPTWTNVAAWKDTPADLPHSGESFTVTYTDWVGNQGTHTFNVVRSQAVTDLSVAVQPMTDGTVPNAKLTFSGSANVWEELILTVGGRTYTPDMLPGNAVYDNSAKRWSYSINIADIDGFPVGEETTVTIAYADLSGGMDSITITYKDHVDEPVLGGEPLAGSQVIWGFVEQQTTDVQIDVYRAATNEWVAVDVAHGNGYFSSELLDEPLAEGDRVRIAVQDFCGNYASAEFPVVTELSQPAFAELLGASITGEVGGEMLHRFATPIDLAALNAREDKSITVPILAYKGIDIGTVTATLSPQGRVEVTYDIGLTSVLAENAQARVHVFADEPTIADIVEATMTVAAEDLNAASSGTLTSVDVAAYQTENGYAGTLWLCAQFDIDMDEEVYCDTVNYSIDGFYRMLPDEMMTEELTGVVRDDSVITYYVDNASYYQLYREFTNRSNMN